MRIERMLKMKKSVFVITKMDCPSEEQMIRMKFDGLNDVKQLKFDIPNRKLEVIHNGDLEPIVSQLHSLNLGSKLEKTEATEETEFNSQDAQQRKILWWVLIINFSFFVIEMVYGWLSKSMGLIADSLDMLADSIVYGLSLLAVGAALSRKKKVAKLSGYFQAFLAFLGLIEVLRRFLGFEGMPIFQNMIIVSFLALIANSVSLYLIQKTRSDEAHMKASAIFTSNDIVINFGVIVAGVLVFLTSSKYPDLIIGTIIFGIVIRGAIRILNLAK